MTVANQVSVFVYQGPEFRHLEYFLAVAEETKFSKAAQRLRVAQPSLSRQIQQLEEGMGTRLFARTQTGVILTPAGAMFLSHAQAMLRMRREAVDQTSHVGSGVESPFRFGFSPWVDSEFVQEVFAGYRELMPGGVLEPTSRGSAPLVQRVLDGRLRAALVHLPVNEPELYIQQVCTEELLVCMRTDDHFNTGGPIPRAALGERLRIMFAQELHPDLFEAIERRLAKARVRLRPQELVLHPAEMQMLVREGTGWALMREHTVLDPALVLRPIEGLSLNVKTAFVCLPVLQKPVLPMLAYRVARFCLARNDVKAARKPVSRVPPATITQQRLFG